MNIFTIGDKVEQYTPKLGFRTGTIVDKILPFTKPDMDFIRKYNLKSLPITKATVQRWVVQLDYNNDHHMVFPENPKRRLGPTIHLTGDVTITLLGRSHESVPNHNIFKPL